NDDRGNGRKQPDRGGEQCFGNAGSNDGKVGRLCLRNADETVHNAPYGPKQRDKSRGKWALPMEVMPAAGPQRKMGKGGDGKSKCAGAFPIITSPLKMRLPGRPRLQRRSALADH